MDGPSPLVLTFWFALLVVAVLYAVYDVFLRRRRGDDQARADRILISAPCACAPCTTARLRWDAQLHGPSDDEFRPLYGSAVSVRVFSDGEKRRLDYEPLYGRSQVAEAMPVQDQVNAMIDAHHRHYFGADGLIERDDRETARDPRR